MHGGTKTLIVNILMQIESEFESHEGAHINRYCQVT